MTPNCVRKEPLALVHNIQLPRNSFRHPALLVSSTLQLDRGWISVLTAGAADHPIAFCLMPDDSATALQRPHDDVPAADQPPTKRQKIDDSQAQKSAEVVKAPLLPPSHALLGAPRHAEPDEDGFTQMLETDVGISEYVGRDIPPIQAVIKQRCTRYPNRLRMQLMFGISGSQIFWSSRSTKTTE